MEDKMDMLLEDFNEELARAAQLCLLPKVTPSWATKGAPSWATKEDGPAHDAQAT
jgi:hypothetical protein